MLNENSLPPTWGKGQRGPVRADRNGDAAMAAQHPGAGGYGVGDGPDRDFIPRFKAGPMDGASRVFRQPTMPMARSAWGGARGVEPVHPGGEDFPIPGHMPARRSEVLPAGLGPLEELTLELARQRRV